MYRLSENQTYVHLRMYFTHHRGASLYHLKVESKQKLGSSKSGKNQPCFTKIKGYLDFT